nr:hypothetical protein CFP56_21640 [Quercus suber]
MSSFMVLLSHDPVQLRLQSRRGGTNVLTSGFVTRWTKKEERGRKSAPNEGFAVQDLHMKTKYPSSCSC